jgi:hypothetical protein
MATLKKLRHELEDLRGRKNTLRFDDVAGLARRLGRTEAVRGKHPFFVKEGRPALSVPHHPGTLSRDVVKVCLTMLEEDLELLEEVAVPEEARAQDEVVVPEENDHAKED